MQPCHLRLAETSPPPTEGQVVWFWEWPEQGGIILSPSGVHMAVQLSELFLGIFESRLVLFYSTRIHLHCTELLRLHKREKVFISCPEAKLCRASSSGPLISKLCPMLVRTAAHLYSEILSLALGAFLTRKKDSLQYHVCTESNSLTPEKEQSIQSRANIFILLFDTPILS